MQVSKINYDFVYCDNKNFLNLLDRELPRLIMSIFCRWGNRATVVAGSAGQEFVDNIFYNYLNDYELMTLNSSIWDVWKSPINAKYNYW